MLRTASLVLCLLAAFVLAGPAGAEETAPAAKAAPKLETSELEFDAGSVARGVKISHTFILKNTGGAEMTVSAKPG